MSSERHGLELILESIKNNCIVYHQYKESIHNTLVKESNSWVEKEKTIEYHGEGFYGEEWIVHLEKNNE